MIHMYQSSECMAINQLFLSNLVQLDDYEWVRSLVEEPVPIPIELLARQVVKAEVQADSIIESEQAKCAGRCWKKGL